MNSVYPTNSKPVDLPRPAISRSLGDLQSAAEHLARAIDALEEKLQCVLRQEPKNAPDEKARPGFGVKLADEIHTHTIFLCNNTQRISSILERIEL